MFVPIMSSTIVTIGIPAAYPGQRYGRRAVHAICIDDGLRTAGFLVVAITLVPAMAHSLFRKGLKNKHDHAEKPGAMARGYRSILKWTLNHKAITFLAAIALL